MSSHHSDRFRGATAPVTGGSRGLGLLIAGELVGRGTQVMICARDPQELATAERELRRRGGGVASTVCDLAEPDAPERLVAATVERFGRLDVLVNNAGLIQVGLLEAFGAEDFDRALDVMVRVPVRLVLTALPGMRERQSGTIVTIASIGGRVPAPHLLPSITAKFALAGLSAGLRAELAADGISVTTVLPGLMRTGSHRAAAFAGRPENEYAWFAPAAGLPLLSTDAARAARAVVRAAERGRPELVLTPAAKLGSRVYGLAPATTTRSLTPAARPLPAAGARPSPPVAGTAAAAAAERRYPLVGTLTGPGDRAGRGTNEPQ